MLKLFLDLTITNLPGQIPRIAILLGIIYHDTLFLEFNVAPQILKQKHRESEVQLYKKANWDSIQNEIKDLTNSGIFLKIEKKTN